MAYGTKLELLQELQNLTLIMINIRVFLLPKLKCYKENRILAVFARITYYCDWIEEVTESEVICKDLFECQECQ